MTGVEQYRKDVWFFEGDGITGSGLTDKGAKALKQAGYVVWKDTVRGVRFE